MCVLLLLLFVTVIIIPMAMAVLCKSSPWGRSIAGIAGLNLAASTNICLLRLCFVQVAAYATG
jgi:hypothetical protein